MNIWKHLPDMSDIEARALELAQQYPDSPGEIWYPLTRELRMHLDLRMSAKLAEKAVTVLFPEWMKDSS